MKVSITFFLLGSILFSSIIGCNSTNKDADGVISSESSSENNDVKTRNLTEEFKGYWYEGKAELTSYTIEQARYGELREGTAVTIFVTEDFLPEAQVKADNISEENIPVLKLNSTKNFLTGIYPYSIMTSTFSPLETEDHAIKVTNSVQEWCGHVFAQLNNRKKYEVESHSYFQNEADQSLTLPKTWLENEFWNLIRINPEELPTGEFEVIPAFEYLRLHHKEIKAYPAMLSLKQGDSLSSFKVVYPELQRDLVIYFSSDFPYEIEKWEETARSGFGEDAKTLTTTATKLKRIKTAYWQQNQTKHEVLRDSLGLN